MSDMFATIKSEGALLPPDLLMRIARSDRTVPGLTPAGYRLDDGQQLGEAISRSWSRLLAVWRTFRAELAKLPTDDPATALTRDRFLRPLFQELGYGAVPPLKKSIVVDDREYAISHAWGDVPIHLLGAGTSLEVRTAGQKGAARSSPHGLVQDLLNRSDTHLWALLTNGLVLRLLRDHHSLTMQAYVEVDLEALFEGERYADFALMWLVFHQTRIEPQEDKLEKCWLEQWFELSRTEGLQALDDLQGGVIKAIEALGQGFLRHPHNAELVRDLQDGVLDRQEYYRELLRLVYRLIFVFSAEDRGLLLDPNATDDAKARYQRFYATRRLRDLAGQTRGGPHGDLWQALRAVMNGLDEGCAPLALPALGSFLWSKEAIPRLDDCELANADLLAALRALSYVERHRQRFPVSWRTVAADELGSIYESLLELHPKLDPFELVTAAGNERKKTGSYYTPTSLVDCLLDSAFEPVIDNAVNGKSRDEAEVALLALKVIDPACGSGHFLVAAARRLARRLAALRTGDEEPSPSELQRALRDVVGRCIYGVDLNEMAVELCKVALWMEAVEPGKPLSFLDAHIQTGNALIGATPALMARGIPDDAWSPIEGDDKKVASALKKRNRDTQRSAAKQTDMLGVVASAAGGGTLASAARDALAGDDEAVTDVRARKRRWEALQSSTAFRDAVFVADTWCAAFVWPKQDGPLAAEAPTWETFARVRKDPSSASKALHREVRKLATRYAFFHWHLAFPEVFVPRGADGPDDVLGWDGGFDCVLGNPPWERVTLKEKEWFLTRDPDIAGVRTSTGSQRQERIAALKDTNPELLAEFREAKRQAAGEKHFLRKSRTFPLCGQGDVNTFAVFAELGARLSRNRVGMVLPTGIVTADTVKDFVAAKVRTRAFVSLFDFDNRAGIFPAVQGNVRFCLLCMCANAQTEIRAAAQLRSTNALLEPGRVWTLGYKEIEDINPNTLTLPLFPNERTASVVRRIHSKFRCLDDSRIPAEHPERWRVSMKRMLHMGDDSHLFRKETDLAEFGKRVGPMWELEDESRYVPLLEAKLSHQFDHRSSTFAGVPYEDRYGTHPATVEVTEDEHRDPSFLSEPRYWVPETEVRARIGARTYLLGFRDAVSAIADSRSLVSAVLPAYGAGHTLSFLYPESHEEVPFVCAWFNALVIDFVFRQKASGAHASFFLLRQLPIPDRSKVRSVAWCRSQDLVQWLLPRVLELTYTSWELQSFAGECGFSGAPFVWDEMRRAVIRAEIDAAFFHVFDLELKDAEFILDTFVVLRDKEIRENREYRTKRLVLERYDAIAAAIASGTQYESPLSPPPGDPRAAHGVSGG